MPVIQKKTVLTAGLMIAGAGLSAWPLLALSESATEDDLLSCNVITDDTARLECFDRVSRELSRKQGDEVERPAVEEPASGSATNEPAVAPVLDEETSDRQDGTNVVPLPDDAGQSSQEEREKKNRQSFRATLVECRLNPAGKYLFFFDNGQVWKQADQRRDEFERCDSSVTITKDMFGYKMELNDGEGRMRIKRLR